MQYENNTAKALRDIVRKLKLYHPQSINVDNHLKIEGKKLDQRS